MLTIPDKAACTSISAVTLVPLTPKCYRPIGPRQMLCTRWVYKCCAVLSCSAVFPSFQEQNASVFIVCEVLLFPRSPTGADLCVFVYVCVCTCRCCAQLLNCVQLFATACAVAHQVPLSMKFSQQECWSGLPFPLLGGLPDPGIEPTSSVSPTLAVDHWATWESHICIATKKCWAVEIWHI